MSPVRKLRVADELFLELKVLSAKNKKTLGSMIELLIKSYLNHQSQGGKENGQA